MSIIGPALLLTVGLVLVAAGVAHLRAPGALRDAVRAHGVLAPSLVPPRLLAAVEILLGAGLVLAALTGGVALGRGLGLAAAALLGAMALYLALARSRQPEGGALPCGCGVGEAPLGAAVVARSAALALSALLGALAASTWSVGSRPAAEVVVAVAAGVSVAIGLALLPAARVQPEPAR